MKEKPKGYVVLPYIRGVSERLKRCYKKRNINLYHKAGQTLRQVLVHPKCYGVGNMVDPSYYDCLFVINSVSPIPPRRR